MKAANSPALKAVEISPLGKRPCEQGGIYYYRKQAGGYGALLDGSAGRKYAASMQCPVALAGPRLHA